MWKSRTITITLLSGLMLTACCVSMAGCGGRRAPDHTWYDASGNRIEERWKTDATGNKVLDAEGRPIPDPHVPYDRYHHPWVFVNGAWVPPAPPAGSSSSTTRRAGTGLWLWGGSGYRTTTSSPAYRSGSGTGSVSPSRSSGSSSISRGGFGSTGMSSGS